MATVFEITTEDFNDDCAAIITVISTFDDSGKSAKSRVAAANSSTLLAAATFEEFIRQQARHYAKTVVSYSSGVEELPVKLAATAWQRTMESLARIKIGKAAPSNSLPFASARFGAVMDFCKGDLQQDIYDDLIHNENNMRPTELNSMFKVSGLSNVMSLCSADQSIMDFFGESEQGKAHGKLLAAFEDFFDRRNTIAHSLNSNQSSGASQILTDLALFSKFAGALTTALNDAAGRMAAAYQTRVERMNRG